MEQNHDQRFADGRGGGKRIEGEGEVVQFRENVEAGDDGAEEDDGSPHDIAAPERHDEDDGCSQHQRDVEGLGDLRVELVL